MSLVCFRDVQKTYRSLQGADYVAVEHFSVEIAADEPFAALDAQTRSLMQEELASIWRGTRTTVLFITHDIDEAVTLGTRIGVMRAGPRSDVKGVLEVALNGARDRTDDVFLRYYKRVHEMIRDEVAKSIARGD